MEVRHLAGEELDVRAADADTLHLDDDLAGNRDRLGHFLDAGLAGRRHDERAHPHRL